MFKLLINSKHVKELINSPLRIVKAEQKQEINDHTISHQVIQQYLLHVSETGGQIYLYKQYRSNRKILMSYEVTNSVYSSDLQIKSQILFINKVYKAVYLKILQHAQQRQEHIQLIELVEQKKVNEKMLMSIIIYFKNSLISQQFYSFVVLQLNSFALYIKQVIVVSKPIHQELQKELTYIVNQFQNKKLQNEDKNSQIYLQQYIQLPRCLMCLFKLQCEVSGLSQSLLQNNILITHQTPCENCIIIGGNNHKSQIKCKICQTDEDIWICMVCGDFGCGRYKNKDAFKHFLATGHIITMDLATQRIWNYISDCFSHRIVSLQKQEVNIKFPDYSQKKNDSLYEQSLEAAFWQYCSLVSQQLERQRAFYSRQKAQQEDKFERSSVETQKYLLTLQKQIDKSNLQVKKLAKKNKKLQKRLAQLRQKCKDDRQILEGYNRYLKEDHKVYTIEQIDKSNPKIQQKLKILASLEQQIQATLLKLQQ